MCHWMLTVAGHVIANTSVQHVIRTECEDPTIKGRIDEFNKKLNDRLAVKQLHPFRDAWNNASAG